MGFRLTIKRLVAWFIDWVTILLYAGLLFLFVWSQVHTGLLDNLKGANAQLIAFITLTLPVVLYCIFMEASSRHATLGKRVMKIKLSGNPSLSKIVFRNILKFLPWEIAHIGVFYAVEQGDTETPLYVWGFLIVPQLLIMIYIATMIFSGGKQTLYDSIANTEVGEA